VRARGYLWERLEDELEAMFHTTHALDPARSLGDAGDAWSGWHVTGAEGDLSGGHGLDQTSTPFVQSYRDAHRAAGLCIDCDAPRHEKSKSYCARHREADRQRAAKKRNAKKARTA
jgi:hypothetical protein